MGNAQSRNPATKSEKFSEALYKLNIIFGERSVWIGSVGNWR